MNSVGKEEWEVLGSLERDSPDAAIDALAAALGLPRGGGYRAIPWADATVEQRGDAVAEDSRRGDRISDGLIPVVGAVMLGTTSMVFQHSPSLRKAVESYSSVPGSAHAFTYAAILACAYEALVGMAAAHWDEERVAVFAELLEREFDKLLFVSIPDTPEDADLREALTSFFIKSQLELEKGVTSPSGPPSDRELPHAFGRLVAEILDKKDEPEVVGRACVWAESALATLPLGLFEHA